MKSNIYQSRLVNSVLIMASIFCLNAVEASDRSDIAFSEPVVGSNLRPADWPGLPIQYDERLADADLVVALDQQQYPAFLPLIRQFATERGVKIAVNNGTCGISAGLLARKAIDVGGYCCPPGPTDRLPGLEFHTLGISSIALIVHPDRKTDSVTITEAKDLFAGAMYEWSEVEPIVPKGQQVQTIGRLHCKLRPGHWRLLLESEDEFSPTMVEVGSIPDMIAQVSSSPLAIGYETLWMLLTHSDRGEVKTLKIDGVAPSDRTGLLEGRYPFYRTYSMATWSGEHAKPLAAELITYLHGRVAAVGDEFAMVPASELRAHGWQFNRNELIGESANLGK